MKTILLTYSGFQSLPKGVRQMLVATESFYYGETIPSAIYSGKKNWANSKVNSHCPPPRPGGNGENRAMIV
jgi:hypothetical protein